ncbi:MAG: hydrogenase formation protein HypD [archaeon]
MNDSIERSLSRKHLEKINHIASKIGRDIKLMEICGGHTNVIMKFGIRELMPKNIKLISGPGCPVCVSAQHDIDCMIELAHEGIPVATYGDMLRVPGTRYNLDDAKAHGGKIFEVYSASELFEIMKKYPEIVFFGIGFETTAPMTAFLLRNNICVYSVHKLVPPAVAYLASNKDIGIDGFIAPGHVSAIIGAKPYREILIPQVIAGFTPERILRAIWLVLDLIEQGKNIVVNGYPEVVQEEGNPKAQEMLKEFFEVRDSEWRGLGVLPKSGLEVKNSALNAKIKFRNILSMVPYNENDRCDVCEIQDFSMNLKGKARCAEILLGMIEPTMCPLFGKECLPENPIGACMVSEEGSCAIAYRYGRNG